MISNIISDRTKKNWRYQRRVCGNSFAHALSRFYLKDNEFTCANPSSVTLNGNDIINRINCFVLKTIINHFGLLYICQRGISQGNPLSIRLCNIYLGAMERQLFPQRPTEIFCRRYIDDYLMIAPNKKKLIEVSKKNLKFFFLNIKNNF